MTPPNVALYFTCLFMANVAHMTTLKQSLQLKSANVGESVTLQCLCEDDLAVMFYWYKQTLGHKPKLVSTFYKHDKNGTFYNEFVNNPRFLLETGKHKNDLKIIYLQISDSATYYCVKSNIYDFEFCEGTTLYIKDSDYSIPALVHQSVSETIQPGGSVTLNCTVHTGTCYGEHSVYWFKDSEESQPGLMYTHGDRNSQCERKPETQTHTCSYNLLMDSLNRSHAGTYYCAVASCGHILFGNENKLEIEDDTGSLVLVYFLSGALAFTTILAVLLAFSVYKTDKHKSQCTESNVTCSATPDTELHQDGEILHYAALRNHKVNRSKRQRDETGANECVYSRVKQ